MVETISVPHPPLRPANVGFASPQQIDGQTNVALAFDRNSTRLAIASDYSAALQILDLTRPSAPIEVPLPDETGVHSLAWMSDGTLAATVLYHHSRPVLGNVLLVAADLSTRLLPVHDGFIAFAGERLLTTNLVDHTVHTIDGDGSIRPGQLRPISGADHFGFGFGATASMIASGLRDRTLAVFDWDGAQRAVVRLSELPPDIPFMTTRPLSVARGTWSDRPPPPQVDAVAGDGAGQLWFATSWPLELGALRRDLVS